MESLFVSLLAGTAWPMETPRPYGFFHLALAGSGILLAILLARILCPSPRGALRISRFGSRPLRVLRICGLILALSEIYKQGFLYYIVNHGHYDWWYFPFQLCSVPMYLALLLPPEDGRGPAFVRQSFCTFIQDYGLLGGIMALAEPSGLMHPYWTLTLHGFFWHFILIFMGLYCSMSGLGGRSRERFLKSLPLFFLCCAIATAINIFSRPYGNADMFYINPYYPNGQIVFRQISLAIGSLGGNLLYLLSVILGAAAVHWILGQLGRRL